MKRINDYFKRATEPEAVDPGIEAEIVDEDEEEEESIRFHSQP